MELNAYKIHDALRSCFEFRWSREDGRLELWWWIGSKVYTQAFPGEHVSQSRSSTSSHTLSLKNRQPFIMATRTAVLGPAPAKSGSNASFNDKV